ncbi:hypothetical protein SAMN04487959_11432 [Modicisalibacter xianhensis]|uniref:Uncharacterized protein n=1 Tax=Modicisalibacter xianhensis TaxID=442341 RepID=A0A1I3EL37_9GAMM|nr:hypothetical protein SAMN04487959_11432 [Halomonas xianhensis]
MLCLDDLTHLFNQGHNSSPLGSQNAMVTCGPTAHRGYRLVSGYSYLAWGHHFHPAIHCGFDLFGIDPSTAFNGDVLGHDFINGFEHFVIGHLSRDRSPCPGMDRGQGNRASKLRSQVPCDRGQRHAVIVTQRSYTSSQVTVGRASSNTSSGCRDADLDLAAMPFKRVDQVVQECVTHG